MQKDSLEVHVRKLILIASNEINWTKVGWDFSFYTFYTFKILLMQRIHHAEIVSSQVVKPVNLVFYGFKALCHI